MPNCAMGGGDSISNQLPAIVRTYPARLVAEGGVHGNVADALGAGGGRVVEGLLALGGPVDELVQDDHLPRLNILL